MSKKKKLSEEEIKTLHYALFWLKDRLGTSLDVTYYETEMTLLGTINALSDIIVKYSDINLNSEQFKKLFKDRTQHLDYLKFKS